MAQLKYPKPKILLIDMPEAAEAELKGAGYNVAVGSFGRPYEVDPSDALHPVSLGSSFLPNLEEQEIIFVGGAWPDTSDTAPDMPGEGVPSVWQNGSEGYIDPRPICMDHARDAFNRILEHGGIVFVHLPAPYCTTYTFGSRKAGFNNFSDATRERFDNFSFITQLQLIRREALSGTEIRFNDSAGRLTTLLRRAAEDATFHCVVKFSANQRAEFLDLAHNKFGGVVAAVRLPRAEEQGVLVLLPEMPNIGLVIRSLIEEVATQWAPKLFPHHEGQKWIYRPEYEIPGVLKLAAQVQRIRSEAVSQIQSLEQQILEMRSENADWYTLLMGTGSELVAAVINVLKELGFQDVIDVDAMLTEEGDTRQFKEDIQVHDRSPVLIIDVKGIVGGPEDAEATQAQKHAYMRAREFKGDVHALTIINHERNKPPHDRNPNPYRDEIVRNAEDTGLGLMTTWDVFRLARNKERLGWTYDNVMPVFYRTGRIEPIPAHYDEVGTIVGVWDKAFGVVPNRALHVGATVAILTGDYFEEVIVHSIMVNQQEVVEASEGSNCGVALENAKERVKKGMRVFLVERDAKEV